MNRCKLSYFAQGEVSHGQRQLRMSKMNGFLWV